MTKHMIDVIGECQTIKEVDAAVQHCVDELTTSTDHVDLHEQANTLVHLTARVIERTKELKDVDTQILACTHVDELANIMVELEHFNTVEMTYEQAAKHLYKRASTFSLAQYKLDELSLECKEV